MEMAEIRHHAVGSIFRGPISANLGAIERAGRACAASCPPGRRNPEPPPESRVPINQTVNEDGNELARQHPLGSL